MTALQRLHQVEPHDRGAMNAEAPGQPILTTQLFFPGEEPNASDGIYDDSLLMEIEDGAASRSGRFNFVLDPA